MNYGVITRAKVAGDYRDQAIEAMKQWKENFLANGSQGVRIGVSQSGSNVGALVAFQFFLLCCQELLCPLAKVIGNPLWAPSIEVQLHTELAKACDILTCITVSESVVKAN